MQPSNPQTPALPPLSPTLEVSWPKPFAPGTTYQDYCEAYASGLYPHWDSDETQPTDHTQHSHCEQCGDCFPHQQDVRFCGEDCATLSWSQKVEGMDPSCTEHAHCRECGVCIPFSPGVEHCSDTCYNARPEDNHSIEEAWPMLSGLLGDYR